LITHLTACLFYAHAFFCDPCRRLILFPSVPLLLYPPFFNPLHEVGGPRLAAGPGSTARAARAPEPRATRVSAHPGCDPCRSSAFAAEID
jgi:hypothetical protein